MKKTLIFAILALCFCVSQVHAAAPPATITATNIRVVTEITKKVLTLTWTASGGAVGDTTISASTYGIAGWYLYSAETNPGATAPTDLYDIVLNDADGVDIAGGLLMNRSETATQLVNIGNSAHGYPVIRGDITMVLSNNVVAAATGTLVLTFVAN